MLPGLAGAVLGARTGNIRFVGGNTDSKAGATSGNSTIALNSGLTGGLASSVSDGDFVLAVFATGASADATLSITDGSNNYTLIDSELYSTGSLDVNLRVAYKIVSGDTATTFGPTGSNFEAGAMAVFVFRNVDSANPLDVAAVSTTGTGSLLPNPGSITSTQGSWIVCVGASSDSSANGTLSNSSLTGVQAVSGSDGNCVHLALGYKDNSSGGAFDCPAFTFSLADGSWAWAAMSIALRSS